MTMKTNINFRDFGGHPTLDGRCVKTDCLYRSGQLDHASQRDRATLQALGIHTLLDLRSAQERRRTVRWGPSTRVFSLPMIFDELIQEGLRPLLFTRHAVDDSGSQLAAIFRLLLKPATYPLLIHCRAGRDRSGFVSAVIQLALGVSAEDVVADYLRSNAYLLPQARRLLVALTVFSLGLFPTRNLRAVFVSQERYIRAVSGRIEGRYGGIAAYLERCGIGARELVALRTLLLSAEIRGQIAKPRYATRARVLTYSRL